MATLTIYAETNDGYVRSTNSNYTTARAGSNLTVNTSESINNVGQYYYSPNYGIDEMFTRYDTSVILDAESISAVTEQLYLYNKNSAGDTIELRSYDWGTSITTADWVASANIANYNLLSSLSVASLITSAYNTFQSSSNFINAINKTGYTSILHNSQRQYLNTPPSVIEEVIFYSARQSGTTQDPKLVVTYVPAPIMGTVSMSGAGDISATGRTLLTLNFLTEPQADIRAPIATHVTVKSPTAYATSTILPEPSESTKIERIVNIDTGDATVCQAIAEELIGRWGRTQVSVSGVIPLDVHLKFKEKIHIKIPQAGIDEPLTLQRKQHDVFSGTTSIVCGDIILDDNELIARMLQDLINK